MAGACRSGRQDFPRRKKIHSRPIPILRSVHASCYSCMMPGRERMNNFEPPIRSYGPRSKHTQTRERERDIFVGIFRRPTLDLNGWVEYAINGSFTIHPRYIILPLFYSLFSAAKFMTTTTRGKTEPNRFRSRSEDISAVTILNSTLP